MVSFDRAVPLLAIVAVIAVNAAAALLPINGYSTGALSDLNPTGFTPAGFVFSIWSLIYVGLLSFGLSQILGSETTFARGDSIRSLVLANAAANIGWIFAWHYRQVSLSFAIMLVILATLIAIYITLRKQPGAGWRQFLAIDAPFSLYFGWITAATLLNLAAAFYDRGEYPFGASMDEWALASVVTAIAIYAWVGALTRDVVYCAVFVWAAYGIFTRPDGISAPVQMVAITGTAMIAAAIVWIAVTTMARLTAWNSGKAK